MDFRYPRALSAIAGGLLALGSGCLATEKVPTEAKKPDVTQPGVLPPPQGMTQTGALAAPGGAVVPAGGTQPAAQPAAPTGSQPAASGLSLPSIPSLAKLTGKGAKVVATDLALGWQPRIAFLPDPSRHGAMGQGLAGQMFLYGGPNLQFAEANGTLTIDMIDESPRPAGQPAAKAERWQFPKEVLKNLKTVDETFGKSYVLFLPWPAYNPSITRVRISARYDPEVGHTLFAKPSVVTIDTTAPHGTPVWSGHTSTTTPITGAGGRQPLGGSAMPSPGAMMPNNSGVFPAGGGAVPPGVGGMMPQAPVSPMTLPPGFEPIAITVGQR